MSKAPQPYVPESKSITYASRISQFLIAATLLFALVKVVVDLIR